MADGGGPTQRRRSEGTRRSRAKPGAGPFGYFLALEKVTRRRRNSPGVSQDPIPANSANSANSATQQHLGPAFPPYRASCRSRKNTSYDITG
jgi:hypothetical protein